ncbi:hypothetical protein GG344DRAFT_77918 [Lentinula edodes]|nr:hypothetical protein GG344DRAFT_77918 [Lentinula edodes]
MNLQGIAVTPDGTRLFGVGTLLNSVDGLRPSLSRTEKRIAVYNIETLVPVVSNIKGITVVPNSHNELLTLISYEDKNTSRLTIHQRYFPKVPTDFAGPSYFGGKNEELVLCVDKIGDLHIWDRESGTLLHRIRAHELGRDVTCIAWNHPHDPFMFATGSLHGSVQLWTRHERQLLSTTLRSASPDDMRNFDIPLPQQEQKWSAK